MLKGERAFFVRKTEVSGVTEYENLLRKINSSYKTCFVLKLFSYIGTVMSIVVFGYLLVFFIEKTFIELLGFLITLGVPFVFVSIVRRLIDAKRPYEIFDFYESPPKKKRGDSFPSRHAFSIFAIGTLCLFVYPVVGFITLVCGALMCIARVLLGIHFIRDVVAGAATGVVCSIIGVLILLV